jgi:hypothetical protein
MDPDRFDEQIGRRLERDPRLAALIARLGPRRSLEEGRTRLCTGDDDVAPLDLVVRCPIQAFVWLELTGVPDRQQAFRLAIARCAPEPSHASGTSAATGTTGTAGTAGTADAPPVPAGSEPAWEPLLDVLHEQRGRWISSSVLAAAAGGWRLGCQGWWRAQDEPGRTDVAIRVVAHARHARGSLLWIVSRTDRDAPGSVHKQVLVAILAVDP